MSSRRSNQRFSNQSRPIMTDQFVNHEIQPEGPGRGDPYKPSFWRIPWNPYAVPRTSEERQLLEDYHRYVQSIDNLVSENKAVESISDNVLRCVARTIITFHNDFAIVSDVSTTVGILSRNNSNAIRLSQLGICEELVNALRSDTIEVFESCYGAIINMCEVISDNRTIFGELGACEALLDLLCSNFEDGGTCEWIISCMTTLATDHPKNRHRLIIMGVPAIFRFLLTKYSGQLKSSPSMDGDYTHDSVRCQLRKSLDILESP